MKKCLLIVVGVLLLCLALPVHAEPVSPKPNQTMPQEPLGALVTPPGQQTQKLLG